MAISRYSRAPVINFGQSYGISYLIPTIRENIKNGNIQTQEIILQGSERLDTLAGRIYGDAQYWWVLACCSNVGHSLQVPPGSIINAPKLEDILKFIN